MGAMPGESSSGDPKGVPDRDLSSASGDASLEDFPISIARVSSHRRAFAQVSSQVGFAHPPSISRFSACSNLPMACSISSPEGSFALVVEEMPEGVGVAMAG